MTASFATELNASYEHELAGRICVRPPYFALRDISWDGGEFSALASSEFPTSLEVGPMSAAERGRHGAIAGLCALAMSQTDSARRYYLAQKAHYRGYFSSASAGASIRFSARVEELSKRFGRATISATVLGSAEKLMDLSVEYLVLPEPTFERLFRENRQATPPGQRLALPQALPSAPGVRTIPSLSPSLCLGHFDHFPALPLAILIWELTQMAGEMFASPYWIPEAQLSADSLCWAGRPVRFEVAPTSSLLHQGSYATRAVSAQEVVAEMQLALAAPP
jgi:hypothetical protein